MRQRRSAPHHDRSREDQGSDPLLRPRQPNHQHQVDANVRACFICWGDFIGGRRGGAWHADSRGGSQARRHAAGSRVLRVGEAPWQGHERHNEVLGGRAAEGSRRLVKSAGHKGWSIGITDTFLNSLLRLTEQEHNVVKSMASSVCRSARGGGARRAPRHPVRSGQRQGGAVAGDGPADREGLRVSMDTLLRMQAWHDSHVMRQRAARSTSSLTPSLTYSPYLNGLRQLNFPGATRSKSSELRPGLPLACLSKNAS